MFQPITNTKNKGKLVFNFIDLFAGAGGLSEGFMQCGFNPVAHVEKDVDAAKTLETRMVYYYLKKIGRLDLYYQYERNEISRETLLAFVPEEVLRTVVNEEMNEHTIKGILRHVDAILKEDSVDHVDLIIGGPPCQAYSLVGRAKYRNRQDDERMTLYKMYTRFLSYYKPKMFVFENVVGIRTAREGQPFRNLQKQLKHIGYEFEYKELNAQQFGVLQNRKRIIIIGWIRGTRFSYPDFDNIELGAIIRNAVVNDLLYDLPPLGHGETYNQYYCRYKYVSDYLKVTKIRNKHDVLTLHTSRPNREQDIEIYRRAIILWDAGNYRLHYDELPEFLRTHKNITAFIDRFKVVEGNMHCCHTVMAHLAKDGHYFIHPDIHQCRSISLREAARLQSFPDNYYFEGSRTSIFTQIGNAVPPLMALGIAKKIMDELNNY